jgi:hypothetical protein
MTVVEDTSERTLLWMPFGTRRRIPLTPPQRADPPDIHDRIIANLDYGDWILGEDIWDVSTLSIVRPDDWHATWVAWRPDGSHLNWYINLQAPMRRNRVGFEAMDLMLDIVAEPDLSWKWKDRDEFDEIVARGIFEPAIADRVTAEALAIIDDLEHRRPPFLEPWPSWRPDPTGPAPALTIGWDEIHS